MDSARKPGCSDVQGYLQQTSAPSIDAPPEWLAQHIAECDACRGALALLVAELITAIPPEADSTCEQHQTSLAGFIDHELEQGFVAAFEADPIVGWHLFICPECNEIYHQTLAVEKAHRAGQITPLPHLTSVPPVRERIL